MLANIPLITNLAESEQLSWDMAKQIIQSQHNLAMYGIGVLVGVAVALMAGSWIWHFRVHKRELEEAVESLKSALTAEGKRDFMELTKRVNDGVEKMRKEIEKSVEERMILFDAEKARLFALANQQMEAWETAVQWWALAIEGHAKSERTHILRIAVDALNWSLGKCEKLEDKHKEAVKKCLPFIPKMLTKEKKQIENKLNKLPAEITKQSETK